jgi:hypothetical protein
MDKRYPIGEFDYNAELDISQVKGWIEDIRSLPGKIQNEVYYASVNQLNTPYREGGWTVRQVIHHIGDSHMNALIRFKLALTEDNPTIKPYDENAWTTTADYVKVSIQDAVEFVKIIHTKWAAILDDMKDEDFSRTFHHPESGIDYNLMLALAHYAWHGNHHLAHIQLVTKKESAA